MLGFKHMGWALALGLLVTLGGAAQAQAADVRLKVAVIHATKDGGQKDPALRKIQGALEKAFGGYTMFKQLAKHDLKLTKSQAEQVVLPNGRSASFTYQGPAGAHQHNIKFAVPDSKVDVDVRLPMNRMFYQAGFKHDGGILILALYLRPL
jgi:hypothetical protein